MQIQEVEEILEKTAESFEAFSKQDQISDDEYLMMRNISWGMVISMARINKAISRAKEKTTFHENKIVTQLGEGLTNLSSINSNNIVEEILNEVVDQTVESK